MKSIFVFSTLLVFISFNNSFAAPQSSSPALSKVITQGVSNCAQKSQDILPIITWGGDIPSIYANGSSIDTTPGSIFEKNKLKFKLKREDVFTEQIKSYLKCESPFLRGTSGMINMASEVLNKDSRTKPVVFYQLSWSEGGDALVVKGDISSPKDLKGKTIALQSYGPHVDYLIKLLSDAGLSIKDVKLHWTKDLTGTATSPAEAFRQAGVDAAMAIIPDALALTSGGNTGTGSEDSVKGAKILLSTKSANKIISDVYAVRSDYYQANKAKVKSLTKALLEAGDKVKGINSSKNQKAAEYKKLFSASAKILLDSEKAIDDAIALYADANHSRHIGNIQFFNKSKYPRSFSKLNEETQKGLIALGLLSSPQIISKSDFNFSNLSSSNTITSLAKERFDTNQVAKVVSKKQQQGTLEKSGLFSFQVYFKANQGSFSAELYKDAFDKAINLASTYGGAVMTVEGHSDPLGFLKKKKAGEPDVVLKRIKQAAKNLSLTRANAVRDSLINFAKEQGVSLDKSQFAVVGLGIENPKTGICGKVPCAPKTEADWLSNMRVEFRIIQVEAEESVFKPL